MNNEKAITNYIYVDDVLLKSKIDLLKKEKEKIIQTFDNIKKDSLGMINYWSGNSGEEAYSILNNYTRNFKGIIGMIDSKIIFLESVLDAYQQMDNYLLKKIEENANIAAY